MTQASIRLRLAVAASLIIVCLNGRAWAEGEGVFLTEQDAPRAVFPDADSFERHEVVSSPDLQAEIRRNLGGGEPSLVEEKYVVFQARHGEDSLGEAVIVEEIGKHRPITFIVGVGPNGRVVDVAVMAYREAYGGEVRSRRFLSQYKDKVAADGLHASTDIKNIAGATLSVEAASRAVKKALAVARAAQGTRVDVAPPAGGQ